MTEVDPGRFTRAAIHCEAGEAELRLSAAGSWQLNLRAAGEREWRLACSGGFDGAAIAPGATPHREPVRLGKLLIDTEARRAFVGEAEVGFRAREFELLAMLASEPNRVFTKQELMRRVWGCEALPSSRTLDSHASRLRVALRRAGAEGLVVNCHGVGYKLWNGAELAAAQSRAA